MNIARITLVAVAFGLGGFSAHANPIAVWFFNELQFTSNTWVIEMHASDPAGTLNGWYLQSNSGTAFFKNNIHIGNWYLLITQDSLLGPLSIDPLGDSLTIHSPGAGVMGQLTFGNSASALICSPTPGQSICCRGGFYYLDNSPTLGAANDTANAMGVIRGLVTDSLGHPLPNIRISSLALAWVMYTDSSGRFDVRDYAYRCELSLTRTNCTPKNVIVQIWPESTFSVNLAMDCVVPVDRDPVLQSQYVLAQNYPNPFNPVTMFSFNIPRRAFVSLKLYDIFGQEVGTVVNELREPGANEAKWDASGMASGVYFYRLISGSFVQTRKLVLMR